MKVVVHEHYYTDKKTEALLKQILDLILKFDQQGVTMAESSEMTAFRTAITESLTNISADIQRLMARSSGMSEEDKAGLNEIAQRVADVAAVHPEDEQTEEAASRRRNS